MIRPATLADAQAIYEIAREQCARYPLKVDVANLKKAILEGVSAGRHFAWVSEDRGKVTGALLAFTSSNLWAQRLNCNISLWVSNVPGDGARLLRMFRNWVTSRRAIKVAGMSPDLEIDPRALALAERIGFERHGGAYLLYN